MDLHKCSTCKEMKARTEFGADRNSVRGFAYRCKPCMRAKNRAYYAARPGAQAAYMLRWREANPDYSTKYRKANKRRQRDWTLRRSYGITLAEYERMLAEQDGGCAICRGHDAPRSLAVDHDHSSGEVRGLLCGRCNVLLGSVRDDPGLLRRMANYLESAGVEIS